MKRPGGSEYRRLEVPLEELQQALARSLDAPLAEADYRKLAAALDTLAHLTQLLADQDTTIRDLRQLLFPASTEKTRNVLPNAGSEAAAAGPPQQEQNKKKKPGHGRNGAAAYEGARRVRTAHPTLERRAAQLAPPIQMCDALSRNLKLPAELKVIVGHCLAHGRRFVAVAENFPEPCRHVLEKLGAVYANDALARQRGLSPEQRLRFHQQRSQPIMDELEEWLQAQLAERRVEPNSGLGTAMTYLLKHWERLTLFLRQTGAPLDNNVCNAAGGIANGMPTARLCRVGSLGVLPSSIQVGRTRHNS
jgi:hypothetical protein